MFWITLRRWWSGWRDPLVYVQPDTVTRWQCERFRRFWAGCATLIAGDEAGPLPPCRFAK